MRKYIYDAIKTKSKAAMRLKANGNVFVTSSGYAGRQGTRILPICL